MKITIKSMLVLCAVLLITGCSGRSYTFADIEVDPEQYEIIGQGKERATGIMLLQIIPIGQNNKIERAIEKIKKDNNGDGLIKITVKESWFWAYILNGYRISVSGTVVKKRNQDQIKEHINSSNSINNTGEQWVDMAD